MMDAIKLLYMTTNSLHIFLYISTDFGLLFEHFQTSFFHFLIDKFKHYSIDKFKKEFFLID